MSYDIFLKEPVTNEVIVFDNVHDIKGGTYHIGGTKEAWQNITYNYAEHYHKTIGNKGIRTIYCMTGAESIPILMKAIKQLENDVSRDYWEATEGNAKKALYGLLAFAQLRPDGIWDGD
ncbi:MAG: hypothetical protein LIR50_00230 [Bacillota bacterium]|nr:hypothetical protein [Bacillota bacterium]